MKIVPTRIDGVVVIEPEVFGDNRGFFMETFNRARYAAAGVVTEPFVQDNLSCSRRGVLRGLHFQNPDPQGKLVYVLEGEVFDVAVDIRAGSPTFSEWVGVRLSSENRRQLYVPPDFAHGFVVLSETALFAYKCTAAYNPAAEGSIAWDDPDIGIEWPIKDPILSEKDRGAQRLGQVAPTRLPRYKIENRDLSK